MVFIIIGMTILYGIALAIAMVWDAMGWPPFHTLLPTPSLPTFLGKTPRDRIRTAITIQAIIMIVIMMTAIFAFLPPKS